MNSRQAIHVTQLCATQEEADRLEGGMAMTKLI